MRAARLRVKAKLCRLGGYFCLVGTVFCFTNGEGPRIWQQYHATHSWPAMSAVVKKFTQHSRTDIEKRNGFYVPLYWMEFKVALNLSPEQCPPTMRRSMSGVPQCIGIYNTVWTDSAKENWRWGSRHHILSTVQVHYDPTGKSGSEVFFAGESTRDIYPWGYIGRGLFALFLSVLCVLCARSAISKAQRWESEFPDQRAGYEDQDGADNGKAVPDKGQILQLNLSHENTEIDS